MIKKLAACVREYKKNSILAPIFITFEVLMEVVIPLIMAKLIDNGVDAGNLSYILKTGGLLALCCCFSLSMGVLSGRHAAIASTGFAKNLRHDMYHHMQGFSFSNIDKFSSASLITRMTTDVSNLQNSYMMIIRTAVRCPLMLIFALVMSFTVHSRLALVFLLAVPILAVGIALIMRTVHPIFKRAFKTYDRLNQVVQENLRGIRVVKAFVREGYETSKFKQISEKIFRDFRKAETIIAFNGPLMSFCSFGCMTAISWIGARLIILSHGSELSTGELMSMLNYVMQILMSLMMLSMVFMMIIMSRASAERITEVLDEQSDLRDPENPVTVVRDGSIEFDDVLFSYSREAEQPVLDHVSLSIRSGETIGILGGTGSSKSSLVQLIPRLYDVKSGAVRVGGVDVRDYSLDALRGEVAMVLQKNVLFSGTIRENLRWGNENATDEELIRACELAQADGFIRELPDGYDYRIEQGGVNVSGGQRQRLCIARALLQKPKILILDDSTSAVDMRTDALIRKGFAEYIPDTTKLIIAQRVASVQDADRIIVLDAGKVCGFGTHEELLRNNQIYREVYESQTRKEDA
ncbi:MAG: ABC transporter ATP-binding protein [Oscillospiraceae bacterium]|nr:ABC transporter ATP-binding protein [Oscillospiraceae bacterium]MBR2366819.1 ABC transporter ATP-binding protein [Oscillospiraceae bacterium]MBR2976813.1 ABC transporter ATP-binding protein [Oscillospiraceae bacterium]MBR3849824.1 ABC transporter ATP-binding protein [Oscillospiraceae bacterium]